MTDSESNQQGMRADDSRLLMAVMIGATLILGLCLALVYVQINDQQERSHETLMLKIEDEIAKISTETVQKAASNGFSQGEAFAHKNLLEKFRQPGCQLVLIGPEDKQARLLDTNNPECYQTIVDLSQAIVKAVQEQQAKQKK